MNTGTLYGGLLARNTVLNFLGQGAPLIIGIITIPVIIGGLGVDAFGVLSLAWVVLGWFSLFDLGLGRATIKFVAEFLGHGDMEKLPCLIWTSIAFQFLLGTLGGIILAILTPLLVGRILNIPLGLVEETRLTFLILAASLPVVLGSAALRGALEASQRFGLVNIVKGFSNSLVFVIPVIAYRLGFHLPAITFFLMLTKLGSAFVYLIFCAKVFPNLIKNFALTPSIMRSLITYGGWVTVSNISVPILTYIERFLIAAIVSVGAVTYYAAPYEVVSRLVIFPGSFSLTLFPAFGQFGEADEKGHIFQLFCRTLRYLIIIITPITIVLFFFAERILALWLGHDFAQKSTVVFQILVLSFFINSLAHIPLAAVQGLGRPDLKAKFDLIEVPLFIGASLFFISSMGISGAATAKLSIAAIDTGLLFWAVTKVFNCSPSHIFGFKIAEVLEVSVPFFLAAYGLKTLVTGFVLQLIVLTVLTGFYIMVIWHYGTEEMDRDLLVQMKMRFFRKHSESD